MKKLIGIGTKKDYINEYDRWISNVNDRSLQKELLSMDESQIEDAFFCDLTFGTGGLRGIIGVGTNRMNTYVVAKASQGLARYLHKQCKGGESPSVVIGYDSRVNSYVFSQITASVLAANGIYVHMWSELNPVSTVSFGIRYLHASAGVMITASHNPAKYNGYKVYGEDGCQITSEVAKDILFEINSLDIFTDVKTMSFEMAFQTGMVKYIEDAVMDSFIEAVKNQSVLFDDKIDKNVTIVYSPLNGTGLKPVTRVLSELGYNNIIIVEEQRLPDGNFPTCPYPNPEVKEAMEIGIKYCEKNNADILIATDPDSDRCGIAVKNNEGEYQLLSGNEVGLILLDYICSQRAKHNRMPDNPIFIKTIVTIDLAEKIAKHYEVNTINVLTGFKYIGEQIAFLEKQDRENDFICAFEESYGYLTGTFVRDKDGVNASAIIAEMFAYYKSRGISLIEKLEELYKIYGYCLNTLHSYEFPGISGMEKLKNIMSDFHNGVDSIAGVTIKKIEDFSIGVNGLPKSDVLKFYFQELKAEGSFVIRPSGTEPKLKVYISVTTSNKSYAGIVEDKIRIAIEERIRIF